MDGGDDGRYSCALTFTIPSEAPMKPGKILRAAAVCLVIAGFVPVGGCAPGWKLLFDGKTTAGWRGFKKDSMPSGWQVVDGALTRVASAGDIMTRDKYANFELRYSRYRRYTDAREALAYQGEFDQQLNRGVP